MHKTNATVLRATFEVEQLYRLAAHKLCQVEAETKQHVLDAHHFQEADALLTALPLAQYDFALATTRLNNARNSIAKEEWGAASYELMLLANTMKNAGGY